MACPRGARRPTLAADGKRGYVLAYEKDPDNHIAVRGRAGRDARSAGRVERGFDVPRTLSRCAEGSRTSLPGTTARSNAPVPVGRAATPAAGSGRPAGRQDLADPP
ncbi:hypothetical protein AB0D78_18940 [Streptomyces avermitilis]|uniref:hypothetical protein n=1 Tax=Streptomyces avermitilis TaxID=33903 RepID=UPI0033E2B1C7